MHWTTLCKSQKLRPYGTNNLSILKEKEKKRVKRKKEKVYVLLYTFSLEEKDNSVIGTNTFNNFSLKILHLEK